MTNKEWFFSMNTEKKVIVLSWDWTNRDKKEAIISEENKEKINFENSQKEKLNSLSQPEYKWNDPETFVSWMKFINDVELENFKYNVWNKTLLFFDTETTWLETDSDIIEISFIALTSAWMTSWTKLFKTDKKISIWAKQKSWITEDMLENEEYFKDSKMYKLFKTLSEDENVIFIAHNIDFDKRMLKNQWIILDDKRTICTLKLVKLLFPDAESYALTWLKYCYPMILQASRRLNMVQEEHRAWYDTEMLRLTFNFILNYIINNEKFKTNEISKIIERMIELTNSLILMKYIPFWQYKWESFEDIYLKNKEYLEWLYITEKSKQDSEWPSYDLIYTIEYIFSKFNNEKFKTNNILNNK